MFFLTRMRKHGGFTLVELLIALAIIIIIAGIAIPQFVSFLEKSRVNAARTELETMGSAIREVDHDTDHYVENLDQLDDPSPPGDEFSPWWGPYISSLPANIEDPWGSEYVYFYWDVDDSQRDVHLGNYPPGPPGWEQGQKTGWKGKPLPPGLWKKLGGLASPPKEGFLLFSCGPDKQLGTADDINYQTY